MSGIQIYCCQIMTHLYVIIDRSRRLEIEQFKFRI
jgi:hypothetical protein